MKICYIPGPETKSINYYSYLPFATLAEVNQVTETLFGYSAYEIAGGWDVITFFIMMALIYYTVVFLQKRKIMKNNRIELAFLQAKIDAMEKSMQDVVNIDKSKF